MSIGANVWHFRRARGISQQQLARMLGWNDYDVDDLECDALSLTAHDLTCVARALGVTPGHLTDNRAALLRAEAEAARAERELQRQSTYLQRERVTTVQALCSWLDAMSFGVVSAAIKTGIWGYDRIRSFWRRLFGR